MELMKGISVMCTTVHMHMYRVIGSVKVRGIKCAYSGIKANISSEKEEYLTDLVTHVPPWVIKRGRESLVKGFPLI